MSMSLEAAAQVMREAMRETVRRHSLWYLVQSGLMILAGILALAYPAISSVAVVFFLGWLLIISGIFQGIGLIGSAPRASFLAAACLGRPVRDRRNALPSQSRGKPRYSHPAPDRLLHGRGHFQSDFRADHTTACQLGLGPGQRHRRHSSSFPSLDQHSGYGGPAHWRIARHRADCGSNSSRPSGLAGTQELIQPGALDACPYHRTGRQGAL
jgi:hypothetical protein